MAAPATIRHEGETDRRRFATAPRAHAYRFASSTDRRGRASSESHADRPRVRAGAWQMNGGAHAGSARRGCRRGGRAPSEFSRSRRATTIRRARSGTVAATWQPGLGVPVSDGDVLPADSGAPIWWLLLQWG